MSTNDKIRNKLVDSMRKTKETAHIKAEQTPAKAEQAPVQTTKTEKNKIVKKEETGNKTVSTSYKVMIDPYQLSFRIWPD